MRKDNEKIKDKVEDVPEKTDKVKPEKKKHGVNKTENGGASKAIKICLLAIAAVLLVGGIVFAVVLMRGDKSEEEFSPHDNNEEIDGSDDDYSKLY